MLDDFQALIDAAIAAGDRDKLSDIFSAMSGFLLFSEARAAGDNEAETKRAQYLERLEALL
jgi:hypothetical protein